MLAGACHGWVGDAIRKHCQGSLRSGVRGVFVVVVALLPKISAEVRDQMSKDVAVASQRVCLSESICLFVGACAHTLQAYAPTKDRVANFLALEAQVWKACPKCEDKDFSDP